MKEKSYSGTIQEGSSLNFSKQCRTNVADGVLSVCNAVIILNLSSSVSFCEQNRRCPF